MRLNFYRSFEEFEREEIRPSATRVGFCLDDVIEESVFDAEDSESVWDEEEE